MVYGVALAAEAVAAVAEWRMAPTSQLRGVAPLSLNQPAYSVGSVSAVYDTTARPLRKTDN